MAGIRHDPIPKSFCDDHVHRPAIIQKTIE